MFVLMQVQHKGSYYLEISEPESEGFKSDEWEEDEQQQHDIHHRREIEVNRLGVIPDAAAQGLRGHLSPPPRACPARDRNSW